MAPLLRPEHHTVGWLCDAYVLPRSFDAALFDLDGVLTDSASMHLQAWRDALFDLAPEREPLDEATYRQLVDGKDRQVGAAALCSLVGVACSPSELADRKDRLYKSRLRREPPMLLAGARRLLACLKATGRRIGVFTASRNATAVLEATGLCDQVDALVDGWASARQRLLSKPAPDLPRECARRLGISPDRCVGFEDSLAGATALRAAGVGEVVGIGKAEQAADLQAAGADVVIASLAHVRLEQG